MWALQCHVTGDNLHTCALICSAVGGLILSHYRRRCQNTPIAHMAARVSVLPLDHAGCVFHQTPERTIKKTQLLSRVLAKCVHPSVAEQSKKSTECCIIPVLYSLFFLHEWVNSGDPENVKRTKKFRPFTSEMDGFLKKYMKAAS